MADNYGACNHVIEIDSDAGMLYAAKNVLRCFLNKGGSNGQVRLYKAKKTLGILGEITQEQIALVLGSIPSLKPKDYRILSE